MSEPSRNAQFADEFNQRFDALIDWAKVHWPEKTSRWFRKISVRRGGKSPCCWARG
ncbi:hypothetical protein RHM62_15885 [Actimicrobium sp. CCC2.4]|uniref:hypothetical protein n=1 Tax=Actimicrobium sp. CCC2.4 TaxID=3048606 RepID=UPI002AC9AA22|nr:hypothetical protein [Actimicrobium sp. CCC2.4]WPX31699.1 hypothetical protein RHM62_15885 [Actimicrobium sp. CCC2.4]